MLAVTVGKAPLARWVSFRLRTYCENCGALTYVTHDDVNDKWTTATADALAQERLRLRYISGEWEASPARHVPHLGCRGRLGRVGRLGLEFITNREESQQMRTQ